MIRSQALGPRGGSAARLMVLAALALAAVAIYFLQSDLGPQEPAAAVPAQRDEPAQRTPGLESAAAIPAATSTATRSAAVPVEVPKEPVAAAEEADPDDGEGEWVEVLCVLANGGAPAVGVDVYALALDESLVLRLETAMASGTDLKTLLRSVVQPVVTDENGMVRVWTLVDRETAVIAIGSDLMGYAHPGVERERVTIELTADHRLRVLVVDSDGVGVRAAVASARAVFGEQRADLITALTDNDGRADLKLPGQMVGQYTPGTLFAGVKGLFPKPVEQPLDLEAPDARLELPPFGWALLLPTSADDAQHDVRLVLRATEPGSDSTAWPEQLEGLTGPDGSLLLGPIALGADLSATGSAVGSPVAWHAEGRGPTVQGETVQLVLQRAAAFPLRARALNPAGEPLVRALLQAHLLEPGAELSEAGPVERLRTDRDGVFTWELPAQTVPGSAVWLTVSRRGVDYTAAFAVPVADASGIDLGDLHFREVPPAAQGRVLDPDGAPIAGATAQLLHRAWSEGGSELRVVATTRTAADGRFVLRAPAAEGDLEVQVSAKGFVRSTHKLEFESDVGDVRLERAGALRGRVLLGQPPETTPFYVGAHSAASRFHFTALAEDGEFAIDGVATGKVDVFLNSGGLVGGDLPLWSDLDFRVEDGVRELGTVDLTGRLMRSELVARAPDGTVVRELYVSSSIGHEDHFFNQSVGSVPDGVHVLWHPAELTAARVSAEGFRRVPFTLHGARQEVTLFPALTVVLRARGAEALPNGVALSALVEGPDPDQPGQLHQLPNGRAVLRVDEPGTYRLRFHAIRSDRPHNWNLGGESHFTFEVLETTVPQEFSVDLPEELLRENHRPASGG